MSCAVLIEDRLRIPAIRSLKDFRRWLRTDDFPENGRIDYISGQIEIDMSPEDLFTHGSLKTEVATVINVRVNRLRSGQVFIDSTRISCPNSDLSVEPDIVYLSNRTIDSGRVKLVAKASEEPGRYIEIEGPPDLVVEIVSDSSETKDTMRLPLSYFEAGVKELWLIDARGKSLQFSILRRARGKFSASPVDDNGFQMSAVLRARYRIKRKRSHRGWFLYQLIERK